MDVDVEMPKAKPKFVVQSSDDIAATAQDGGKKKQTITTRLRIMENLKQFLTERESSSQHATIEQLLDLAVTGDVGPLETAIAQFFASYR